MASARRRVGFWMGLRLYHPGDIAERAVRGQMRIALLWPVSPLLFWHRTRPALVHASVPQMHPHRIPGAIVIRAMGKNTSSHIEPSAHHTLLQPFQKASLFDVTPTGFHGGSPAQDQRHNRSH